MNEQVSTKPGVLSSEEINKLLSMTLIANLCTTDNDGTIHLLPMWFMRIGNEICIPTSHHTHKYRNLRARPHASVMIDVSKAGLDLKGVLISGQGETGRWKRGSTDQPFNPPEIRNLRGAPIP